MLLDLTPDRICGRARHAIHAHLLNADIRSRATSSTDTHGLRVDVRVNPADLDRARARIVARFGRSFGPVRIYFEARALPDARRATIAGE